MDDNKDEGLTPEQINNLVFSAVDPEAVFRRQAAGGLVREFHKKFGDVGLVDLVVAVDNVDRFSSLIVLERGEIDNYTFAHHGTFDPDMMQKIQMTEAWEEFVHDVIQRSGLAASKAIEEVLRLERGEGNSGAGDPLL
jgi:hypothetical protein